MECLTPSFVQARWTELNDDLLDPYGGDSEVRNLIVDEQAEQPKVLKACRWLEGQLPEFKEFFAYCDYEWALHPESYGLGTEAHWQIRILQQLESLDGIYRSTGRVPPPMNNVVVRQTFVTSYEMMSPRYRPYAGVHFILVPQSYLDWAYYAWSAMTSWCSCGEDIEDPWIAPTKPISHLQDPDPSPALLEAIVRQLAIPGRDTNIHSPDAAAKIALELETFRGAAGLQGKLTSTAFDEAIAHVLMDYTLSHEAGHRLAEHRQHSQIGDNDYLKVEREADSHGFDLFRASWGWRSELLESTGLDEAGRIAIGPLVFFHTARLRCLLVQALAERLSPGRDLSPGFWNQVQESRARSASQSLVGALHRLVQNGHKIEPVTLERVEALAANTAAFGDYMQRVIRRLPMKAILAADEIAKGCAK